MIYQWRPRHSLSDERSDVRHEAQGIILLGFISVLSLSDLQAASRHLLFVVDQSPWYNDKFQNLNERGQGKV